MQHLVTFHLTDGTAVSLTCDRYEADAENGFVYFYQGETPFSVEFLDNIKDGRINAEPLHPLPQLSTEQAKGLLGLALLQDAMVKVVNQAQQRVAPCDHRKTGLALLLVLMLSSCARSVSDSSAAHDAAQTDSLGMMMKVQVLNALDTLHAHLSAHTPGDLVILMGGLLLIGLLAHGVIPWLVARIAYDRGHWDGRLMQAQRNPMPRARRRDDVEFAAQHETGVDPV
jgi:hypothetical protein